MLQIGDRVLIAPTSKYYRANDSYNPIDIPGTIDKVSHDMDFCGVKWDNGAHNGYNQRDLLLYNESEIKNNYLIF